MLHNKVNYIFKGTRKIKGDIKTAVQYTTIDDAMQIDSSTGLQKHRNLHLRKSKDPEG